jgi:hypothetical protein
MSRDGVCEALTAMLRSRTEWDEDPGLYFVYRDGDGVRLSPQSVIPDFMWMERPPESLAFVAKCFEEMPPGFMASVAPADLLGAAFRFEGWPVAGKTDSPEFTEAQRGHRAGKLHEHPARIEERSVCAATRDGTVYMAAQARGSREITARKVDGWTGLIPSSLLRIIRALSADVN